MNEPAQFTKHGYHVEKTPAQALESAINRLGHISHLRMSDEALRHILKLKADMEAVKNKSN